MTRSFSDQPTVKIHVVDSVQDYANRNHTTYGVNIYKVELAKTKVMSLLQFRIYTNDYRVQQYMELPDIVGVSTPSPIAIQVPRRTKINRTLQILGFFSNNAFKAELCHVSTDPSVA